MQPFASVLKKLKTKSISHGVISVAAVLISLCFGMILIKFMGISPAAALAALYEGSFSSLKSLLETTVKMTPLLFTGMSYAIAYRCGLTNLGMEGQLYMGAVVGTAVGIYFTGLPAAIHLPAAILAGFIGGGLWGLVAGGLKVWFGASEIITTVMLNTIAVNFAEFMVNGPMIEPSRSNSQTSPILESAQIGKLFEGTRAHWGFFIALGFIFLFWLFLWRSKKGYEVRVSGLNRQAALYSGINIEKNILLVMFLAGGLAGLAGCIEILAVQIRMVPSISPGFGFDGIAVALIGNNTPIGIVLGALLFGAFRAGGNRMQMRTQTPISIVNVIQAFVIIAVISSNILLEKLSEKRLKNQKQEA
jgi:simple sugar transport system permease protein